MTDLSPADKGEILGNLPVIVPPEVRQAAAGTLGALHHPHGLRFRPPEQLREIERDIFTLVEFVFSLIPEADRPEPGDPYQMGLEAYHRGIPPMPYADRSWAYAMATTAEPTDQLEAIIAWKRGWQAAAELEAATIQAGCECKVPHVAPGMTSNEYPLPDDAIPVQQCDNCAPEGFGDFEAAKRYANHLAGDPQGNRLPRYVGWHTLDDPDDESFGYVGGEPMTCFAGDYWVTTNEAHAGPHHPREFDPTWTEEDMLT